MSNANEVWRVIPEAIGYEVSDQGRVRTTAGRVLKPHSGKSGYFYIGLTSNSKRRIFRTIHRLVLVAFRGSPGESLQACHNNGIRTDNRLENLRWATAKENHADKKKHGTELRHEARTNSVLTNEAAKQIVARLNKGELQEDLAKEFGTSQSNVSRIARGLLWSEITGVSPKERSKKRVAISSMKLTVDEVKEIAERASRGETASQLSREFKVSRTMVANIKEGKSWSHITNISPVQNGVRQ